ncbi:MAG TPA: MucR family transcriptional regulator [Allosphingosinicella sp.]|uniref:MucR family transcriptional regulator n=1 Tax=Allosphingosinicella sp. TaxID=2823234 RepID=UPI002F2A44BE
MTDETLPLNTVELATELTVAWLSNPNNRVAADEVPAFLQKMHSTLNGLSEPAPAPEPEEQPAPEYQPAVTVRKSLASPDRIISMIDGKPYRTLRRHLSGHGLTPEQYRERYKLKADYPMVAPAYSEQRRAMAHKIGLGAKGRQARSKQAPAADAPPKPARGRRKKVQQPE